MQKRVRSVANQTRGFVMCFRPAAVTLDPNAKNTTPEYRVAATATVDLREHMEKEPHKVITADNITWEVERDEDGLYVAKGDLTVPVEMRFKLDEETGALIKQRVYVDGTKRFDVREHKPKDFDPLDAVDVDGARAQAINRYSKNISGDK